MTVSDDGLLTRPVGTWAEEKYSLLAHYARIFSASMQGKWDALVYIDLFAGPGRVRIRDTGQILDASPLVLLGIVPRFNSYIFCDIDSDALNALDERVGREYPMAPYQLLEGDVNQSPEKVLAKIPRASAEHTVLTLCFLDPYQIRNLAFSTIERLASRYVDFLALIPSGMDANRNEHNYTRRDDPTLDVFLGNTSWRTAWQAEKQGVRPSFERFVAREFGRSMEALGYENPGLEATEVVRNEKNVAMYRLSLYSRHRLGDKFWKQAQKYSKRQRELF